jgi:hypothetical protein
MNVQGEASDLGAIMILLGIPPDTNAAYKYTLNEKEKAEALQDISQSVYKVMQQAQLGIQSNEFAQEAVAQFLSVVPLEDRASVFRSALKKLHKEDNLTEAQLEALKKYGYVPNILNTVGGQE